MDPSCLKYALTDEESEHFEREGYLVVEDALPPKMVDEYLKVIDDAYADGRLLDIVETGIKGYVTAPNFVGADKAFLDLVDYESSFSATPPATSATHRPRTKMFR